MAWGMMGNRGWCDNMGKENEGQYGIGDGVVILVTGMKGNTA
jgi:hypothetical protein